MLGNEKKKGIKMVKKILKEKSMEETSRWSYIIKNAKQNDIDMLKDFTTLLQEKKESQDQLMNAFKVLGYEL